ncbi:GntR family transcriptional regulator [Luteolibacter ambystomatis]|uniref:GntR family transcriptional regulator n=1 Tax=Luteolibacter ambystomatis TaxID=2824561 RepID=A0A975G8K7_9BACT|nr:S1-like domain-containing RNA-binding protein [Luteolibacter ambystomatis]QUE50798.1 GntR family transcriptional regulator [Luteolibacter ambystomatis]
MAMIGERADLKVVREQPFGIFLDGGDLGEILLPRREMPVKWSIGEPVDVFLYRDSEDRPVATLKEPKVKPGQFAYLEVLQITNVGAFLDWGLPKDLLVPFREQKDRLEIGKSYVVYCYVDEDTGRIVATRRLSRHLDQTRAPYREGDEVDLLLYGKTELGYKAIINGRHTGLLFANQVFRRLRAGERTKGYVALIRDDGKIDLSLDAPGRERISSLEAKILHELEGRGGWWELHDDTPAEEIHRALGVSKRAFKQATGALFRQRKIRIEPGGLRLL